MINFESISVIGFESEYFVIKVPAMLPSHELTRMLTSASKKYSTELYTGLTSE